jgi:hypothetical protein
MIRFLPTIAGFALAFAFLSTPAPMLTPNAFANKMTGNYGCSEGTGRCKTPGRHATNTTRGTKKK